jgi:hypothetical protein
MLHRLWDAIAGGDRHLEIAHEQLPKAFLDPVELLKFERALSTDIGRRNAIKQALASLPCPAKCDAEVCCYTVYWVPLIQSSKTFWLRSAAFLADVC